MTDPPSTNISNYEGWPSSYLIGALIAGFISGGLLVWSLFGSPEDLERTKQLYEERIREAELEKDKSVEQSNKFMEAAELHRNRADDLEKQVEDLSSVIPEKPAIPEEKELPPEITTKVNQQILDLRDSLSSLHKYTNNIERQLELEKERSDELKKALDALRFAHIEATNALVAETRKSEIAEQRVSHWERVSISRRKVWLIAGSSIVATIVVGRLVK